MILPVYSIICKFVLIDSETKNVSYIECIERLSTSKLPRGLPSITMSSLWEKDSEVDEKIRVRVIMENPSGSKKPILSDEKLITSKRLRFNLDLAGVKIEESGRHIFIIKYIQDKKWKTAFKLPLRIVLSKKQSK